MTSPEIFDRAARRRRRDRIVPRYAEHAFLREAMVEGLAERLDSVSRRFTDILDLGCFDATFASPTGARIARCDAGSLFARAAGGVQADEDRLPFADGAFDLVVSAGVLDQVNDLPGALTLIQRVLRPDGLFLGAFVGGTSLPKLRAALRSAQIDRPTARLHPAIDLVSAGDLLGRAGLTLPVADVETLSVRYASIDGLLADMRGMGASNLLTGRTPLTRGELARAADAFSAAADPDGRTTERFDLIFVTAWSPSPDQPKPAARGSGRISLADALGRFPGAA
ncbi:class I SAM-dependent methyltransferase [uncultured Sphingomonas sp.]|uniref:class I SAM-dependent methyltransferase n=1 Tax=uncultured Sphingomonas sp. TaxID=158754 RepID=UPI0035CB2F59